MSVTNKQKYDRYVAKPASGKGHQGPQSVEDGDKKKLRNPSVYTS